MVVEMEIENVVEKMFFTNVAKHGAYYCVSLRLDLVSSSIILLSKAKEANF